MCRNFGKGMKNKNGTLSTRPALSVHSVDLKNLKAELRLIYGYQAAPTIRSCNG